jgi:hypothetical protein
MQSPVTISERATLGCADAQPKGKAENLSTVWGCCLLLWQAAVVVVVMVIVVVR